MSGERIKSMKKKTALKSLMDPNCRFLSSGLIASMYVAIYVEYINRISATLLRTSYRFFVGSSTGEDGDKASSKENSLYRYRLSMGYYSSGLQLACATQWVGAAVQSCSIL